MNKNFFYFFPYDLPTVYNAYDAALRQHLYIRYTPVSTQSLSFPLDYSITYKMNGTCGVTFYPVAGGTNVQIQFNVYQVGGTKCERFTTDLNQKVALVLSTAQPIQQYSQPQQYPQSQQYPQYQQYPQAHQYPQSQQYAPQYISPNPVQEQGITILCPGCGIEVNSTEVFCHACGTKI